jgi:hypothetical protein
MAKAGPLITGIVESGIAEDFSCVQITFGVDQGKPLVCRARPDTLQRIIIHLSEMAASVRSQTLAKGDKRSIPAIVAVEATAQAPVGGNKVILGVRGGNNVAQYFALTQEIAARLRSQLQTAAESVKQ